MVYCKTKHELSPSEDMGQSQNNANYNAELNFKEKIMQNKYTVEECELRSALEEGELF